LRCSFSASIASLGSLRRRRLLRVLVSPFGPDGPVYGYCALFQVHLRPPERSCLLGAYPGQQGHDHVGGEPVLAARSHVVEQPDRLVQGHGLGRAALLAVGHEDQAGHVPTDLVPGLGVPDGPLQDLVDQPECPGRKFLRSVVHPRVQPVGGQLLEPGRAELRDQVVARERAVVADRLRRLSG
jgi:hypothetical protein